MTASADEVRVGADGREALDVTIYSNGLSLIRDRRPVDLAAGGARLALAGVSPQMIPSSLRIGADGITVTAVDYDFDVMSADSLLRRALGAEVGVVRTHPTTGEETVERATVLSVAGGLVLRYRDRIETGSPGRLVFDAVPADLRAEPTLVASVVADAAGSRPVELTYLTGGLGWAADYAVIVDDAAKTLTVEGRATISNESRLDLVDAAVALIAGEVNRVSELRAKDMETMAEGARMMAAPAAAPMPEREAFADLHLYRLPAPVSVGDRQTRQVALLAAAGVPFEREYVSLDAAQAYYLRPVSAEPRPSHPEVRLRFVNSRETGGGAPMPAGVVRLYGRDATGAIRLMGEDQIDHTPVGERVELVPGTAFDVTVLRQQRELVRSGLGDKVSESAHRITVKNGRAEAVTVRLIEMLPGDWRVLSETLPHQKPLADRAEWTVTVPAGGETVLDYRVRTQI